MKRSGKYEGSGHQRGRWLTPSRARVQFFPGERRGFCRTARRLFREELALPDWAGLAGAPDEALVELGTSMRALYLEFHDPRRYRYSAVRLIEPTACGLVLVDDGVRIRYDRLRQQQLERRIFQRQLQSAQRWGIAKIRLVAERRVDEDGYYRWPRRGFDGPLPAEVQRGLPAELCSARRVLELMSTPAGRDWWRVHGLSLELVFDLDPAGPCWQTFRRYLAGKSVAPRPPD